MGVDYKELSVLRNQLVKVEKDFREEFMPKFMLQMGLRALAKVKRKTVVRTGYLRNMWQVGDSRAVVTRYTLKNGKERFKENKEYSSGPTLKSVQIKGDYFEIEIINPAYYASYYEYGHRTRGGKAWVPGRFVANISVVEVERDIPSQFKKFFRIWLTGKFGVD